MIRIETCNFTGNSPVNPADLAIISSDMAIACPRQLCTPQNMRKTVCVLLEKTAKRCIAVSYPEIFHGSTECG
jgi:hypothetical protein